MGAIQITYEAAAVAATTIPISLKQHSTTSYQYKPPYGASSTGTQDHESAIGFVPNIPFAILEQRGLGTHLNTTFSTLTAGQTTAIQTTSCVLAGISLILSVMSCYWFSRMRKKFRHKLIIILIIGDLIRTSWYFIFPIISLIHGHIPSETSLCQASGYLTQVGTEIADYAILVIAIHMALQVFNPRVTLQRTHKETGLYRYRYAVYGGAATIPTTICALAFIQGKYAYLSQGPMCSLPLRPFWYRLALSWIPRYIIMLTIGGLYVAIYIHVQSPSSRWKRLLVRKKTPVWETVAMNKPRHAQTDGAADLLPSSESAQHDTDSHDVIAELLTVPLVSRVDRPSDGTTLVASMLHDKWSKELASFGRRGTLCPSELDGTGDERTRANLRDSMNTSSDSSKHGENIPDTEATDTIGTKFITHQMQARQKALQRQLHRLLIYPLSYFAIWTFPFALHACNYDDYLVTHPIFPLVMLAYISITSMGFINSLMFCLREKPWKHITGSDGTFWGSFSFWTHDASRRISNGTDSTSPSSRNMSTCSSQMQQRSSMMVDPSRPRIGSVIGPQTVSGRNSSVTAAHVHDLYGLDEILASGRRSSRLDSGGSGTQYDLDFALAQQNRQRRWQPRGSILEIPQEDELDEELDMIDRQLDNALMRQDP